VRTDRLTRLRPGAFWIRQPLPEHPIESKRQRLAIDVAGAVLVNPTAVASHASAAVLSGLPTLFVPESGCVTVPPGFVGAVAGIHLHRARLPGCDVSSAGSVAVTSVARTVVDLGREHGMAAAVVSADAALHAGLVTVDELRQQVRACSGWPGVRAARRAVEFADGRAESPLESSSRLKLDGIIAAPELQASVMCGAEFLGRADFFWPAAGVIGEADGLHKYDEPDTLRLEKLRQERLEQAGLIVVRWGFHDLDDVDALVARLHTAILRGRQDPRPRRWTAHLMPRVTT
jgi:hypothetical protein